MLWDEMHGLDWCQIDVCRIRSFKGDMSMEDLEGINLEIVLPRGED